MVRQTFHFVIAAAASSAVLSGCAHRPAPPTMTEKPSDEQPVLHDVARNRINLPAGTSLDAITVRGRDLLVQLPGRPVQVIPNGAIDVPEIWTDGVVIAPATLAALLLGEEPQPASAGPGQPSTGPDPASHYSATDGSGIRPRSGGSSLATTRTHRAVGRMANVAIAPRHDTSTLKCAIGSQSLDGLSASDCAALATQLGQGCMGFRDREAMVLNRPTRVKVALRRGLECTGLADAVESGGQSGRVRLAQITVTRVMYADLEGPDFKIEPLGERRRDLRQDVRPVWAWTVTPVVKPRDPQQKFTLTAKLGIELEYPDGSKVALALDIQDQQVEVTVSQEDAREAWGDWLVGWILWPMGILAAIATLAASIKKTRDSVLGLFRKAPA